MDKLKKIKTQYCVITDVPQPFARDCPANKDCGTLMDGIIRRTEKTRSLINGCGTLRGFHPRSAGSLRERRGTSGKTPCSLESSLQKKDSRSLARSFFPRSVMRNPKQEGEH